MEQKIIDTKFIKGVSNLKNLPNDKPCCVILGRANVGKSSIINRLCERKNLAKTSKTPGRTQEFNFYSVTYKNISNEKSEEKKEFYFVDLPGFGYSKFSVSQRNKLSKDIIDYLSKQNENIFLVLLLNDSRRDPKEEELAIQKVCFENGKLMQVVLTKIDKLKKNDIKKRIKEIATIYNLESEDILISGEKVDINIVWNRVFNMINLGV